MSLSSSLLAVVEPTLPVTLREHLWLGFRHVVPDGLDHILFVLALFFLSPRWKPLLLQLTAFTAAHTLTLAVVASGMAQAPPSVVEPLIAASIVFVAVENLARRQLDGKRLAVVLVFGLLHGTGFAGALAEHGLPPGHEWIALAAFNLGVEFGQVVVVLAALTVTWPARVDREHPRWIRIPASGAIALMGLIWTVERVLP